MSFLPFAELQTREWVALKEDEKPDSPSKSLSSFLPFYIKEPEK